MRLKAYEQDYNYKHHWDTIYHTPKDAIKIVKKLLRHFKLRADIYFNTYSTGFASYTYKRYIKLPKKDISLGMIAHEVGHLLAYKYGYRGHTKKTYKYINRVYRYSIKYIPTKILFNINYKFLLLT